jgi:hypothetical protein
MFRVTGPPEWRRWSRNDIRQEHEEYGWEEDEVELTRDLGHGLLTCQAAREAA